MVPVGKEQIITAFDIYKDSKHIHWKIYSGYNARQGAVMASSEFANPDKNIDAELSRAHLKKCLALLIPGNYMIQFKDAPNATNNIMTSYFEVEAMQGLAGVQQQAGIGFMNGQAPAGFISSEHHRVALEREVEKVRADYDRKDWERRFSEMEKKLKDTKKESGSEMMKDIVGMLKVGMGLLQSNQPTRTQIALSGLDSPNVPSSEDVNELQQQEDKAASEAAAKKLLAVYQTVINEIWQREGGDENGIKLLYCLNAYCKANPALFENVVKPQLQPFEDSFFDLLDA